MAHQSILFIDDKLRSTFVELENVFGIRINQLEVERVFDDYENMSVSSFKTYTFYKETFFLIPTWLITGTVEEHEPETIFLISQGGFGRQKAMADFFKQHG